MRLWEEKQQFVASCNPPPKEETSPFQNKRQRRAAAAASGISESDRALQTDPWLWFHLQHWAKMETKHIFYPAPQKKKLLCVLCILIA